MPDLERRDQIDIASDFNGMAIVAMMGHYLGSFERSLFDIPRTHKLTHLRYGEFHEVHKGIITRSWLLVDFLDLMRQANCSPIAPPLGFEGVWASPATQTGLLLESIDPLRSAKSLDTVGVMHRALLSFNGCRLDSMDHTKFWTSHFMWYGPAGIGTTRGMEGFRAHH